jgi:phosphatidylserine decarboxylase
MLTSYGRREWGGYGTAILALGAGLGVAACLGNQPWLWGPAGVVGLLWLGVLAFFRDPTRTIPDSPGVFVSPADGRVADITPVGADGPLGQPARRIGIFMNLHNVHVNRMPFDGTVRSIDHRDGRFLDARHPQASELNESALVLIDIVWGDLETTIGVRQVAGKVARRIVTDLKPDQPVRRGERFGMIKFGSRLELIVPDELDGELNVRVGQVVRAGASILFTAKGSPS